MADETKPIWKRVSTYLALGIPAFVAFLANTKPDEALTNLAGWAKLAGIDRVPQWLATNSADLGANIAAGVCFVVVGIELLRDVHKVRKARAEMVRAVNETEEGLCSSKYDIRKLNEGLDRAFKRVEAQRDPDTGRFYQNNTKPRR
jgi:hypothetical protein